MYKNRELSADEMHILVSLQMAKEENISKMYEAMKKETHVLEAIDKRANSHGYSIDKAAQIMIISYSDSVIGKAVKYIDHIAGWVNNRTPLVIAQQPVVTFEDLNMRIFPLGPLNI